MTQLNSWAYKDKHVDTSVTGDNFLTSSRCIVYAQVDNGGAGVVNNSNYVPIGLIQGYGWSEQKQIEMIFELGSEVPYLVPGRTTGQLSISRLMLFGRDLVNVLHGKENASNSALIKSLKDITKPINLMFVTFGNVTSADAAPTTHYSRVFRNCWITSRSESVGAGQTVIAESCNIMYDLVSSLDTTIQERK